MEWSISWVAYLTDKKAEKVTCPSLVAPDNQMGFFLFLSTETWFNIVLSNLVLDQN